MLAQGALPPAVNDPFISGERWVAIPPVEAPSLVRDLARVGDTEFLVGAHSGQTPGLSFWVGTDPTGEPRFRALDWDGSVGLLRVLAAGTPRGVFGLGGFDEPGGRRFELRRYDAIQEAKDPQSDGLLEAVATIDLGFATRVEAHTDDQHRVVVVTDPGGGAPLTVRWFAGASGALLFEHPLPTVGLRDVSIARDGERVAVLSGEAAFVLDANGQSIAWTTTGVQSTIALAPNGSQLAFGDLLRVRRLNFGSSGWSEASSVTSAGGEMALELAFSGDSSTLAVGWSHVVTTAARVVAVEATGATIFEVSHPAGTLQNRVSALELDDDGSRLALGLWGGPGAGPELLLYELADASTVLEVDLEGSVDALVFSEDGTRVAAAHREHHANLPSTTGAVRGFDTGERDLALISGLRPGGWGLFRARVNGADPAWFVLGVEAASPRALFGGALSLDPAGPLAVFPGGLEAWGRRALDLPVPSSPSLVGFPWMLQAVTLTSGAPRLLETVLRPRSL